MKISTERKGAEAIKRMKALNIIGDAIEQFRKSGQIMCSEPPMGALYWIDDEQKKLVEEFEQEHNALVYMVIRTYFAEFGKMDALLYVSDYKEEWDRTTRILPTVAHLFMFITTTPRSFRSLAVSKSNLGSVD